MPRRVLRDSALIVVRDHYQLDRFIDKRAANEGRRRVYFDGIDGSRTFFRQLSHDEATDDDLIYVLMKALQNDDTFRAHVRKRAPAATLMDAGVWEKICRAGAGTVLQQYVNAVDGREWPLGGR